MRVLRAVHRALESASSENSSKNDEEVSSDVENGLVSAPGPEREKTEEEKANWMAEYAPVFESMYDKVKRKRGASAKALQNMKANKRNKKRRKRYLHNVVACCGTNCCTF